jgi:ParB-like chromosome segregation protein Spo0J
MGKICYLKIEDLKEGEKRLLKPLKDGEFEELLESIREYGIITPLVKRKGDIHGGLMKWEN